VLEAANQTWWLPDLPPDPLLAEHHPPLKSRQLQRCIYAPSTWQYSRKPELHAGSLELNLQGAGSADARQENLLPVYRCRIILISLRWARPPLPKLTRMEKGACRGTSGSGVGADRGNCERHNWTSYTGRRNTTTDIWFALLVDTGFFFCKPVHETLRHCHSQTLC